jgi:ATP-binding cassette subfamily F protein uup
LPTQITNHQSPVTNLNYLTLENINKSYGEKTLFRNVNLQVSKGQKVALIAKNGSGKTTLMRVIAGTEPGEGENCQDS